MPRPPAGAAGMRQGVTMAKTVPNAQGGRWPVLPTRWGSYLDDIDKAKSVLHDVIEKYESCLAKPAPVIRVGSLGESSVDIICRPWVRTEDYWDTYWDLMEIVKKRFDEEGISIPFPQRDVHLHQIQPT